MSNRVLDGFRGLLVLAAMMLATGVIAAPVGVGMRFPALSLDDQHDKALSVPADARLVLFAADRAGSDLATGFLAAQPAGVLDRLQAVYLADISAMPALVTRMFALPTLRALPFRVGLAREASVLADLPRQGRAVTVIRLVDGRVERVDFAADAAQLKTALGLQ